MIRFNLTFGAKIHCLDGNWGQLAGVVTDAEGKTVTDLLVEKGVPLLKRAWVLPISLVKRTTAHGVYLDIPSAEISHFPEYEEIHVKQKVAAGEQKVAAGELSTTDMGTAETLFEAPTPIVRQHQRQGISSQGLVLDDRTQVSTSGKTIGHLNSVRAEADSHAIDSLVVQRGLLQSHRQSIPVEMVDVMDERKILLSASHEEISALSTDEDSYDEAHEGTILKQITDLLGTNSQFRNVDISVADGVVRLSGQVDNEAVKTQAVHLAGSVDGVAKVETALALTATPPVV